MCGCVRILFAGAHSGARYCRGDQGFLNAYYPDFINSHLFNPDADYNETSHKSMLLPTAYNADIGLYVVNSNRWLLSGRLKVIHFTFGPFKPWKWWAGWLVEEQTRWNVRFQSHGHMVMNNCTCRRSCDPSKSMCTLFRGTVFTLARQQHGRESS